MRFIIKSADSSLHLILEAAQYQNLWTKYARKIRKAFRDVTGLEFQQQVITARVSSVKQSNAGFFNHPMELAGDNRSKEQKLLTIMHELSHRLIGGYALDPHHLGVYEEGVDSEDVFDEIGHRYIYLFHYDVVVRALGEEWGKACVEYESWNPEDPHTKAWKWAMSMAHAERQRALKQLVKKGFPRERWDEVKTPGF